MTRTTITTIVGAAAAGFSLTTVIATVPNNAVQPFRFQSLQTIHNGYYFAAMHASFFNGVLQMALNGVVFMSMLKSGQEVTAFIHCI